MTLFSALVTVIRHGNKNDINTVYRNYSYLDRGAQYFTNGTLELTVKVLTLSEGLQ